MKEKARIDYIPIPRKLQDIIPVKTIYLNGIFRLKNGRFSKSYRIKKRKDYSIKLFYYIVYVY